jgi:ferredoxin-thioredoxin reductase catalytic chain
MEAAVLVNCGRHRFSRKGRMSTPSEHASEKMWKFVKGFADKSGTTFHPNTTVTEAVVNGLAAHVDELGKPLCPCNFYQDKQAEAKLRRWICACDEMQIYKYCHCLLFVREDGLPITEYLPEDHEGRQCYGVVTDPTPDKGRALRHKAASQNVPPPAEIPNP